jgi:hypothetical protein
MEVQIATAAKILGIRPHVLSTWISTGEIVPTYSYQRGITKGRALAVFVDLEQVSALYALKYSKPIKAREYAPLIANKDDIKRARARRRIEAILDERKLKREIEL